MEAEVAGQPWLNPEAISSLVEDLRDEGFMVDLTHCIAAIDLVLLLAAHDAPLDDPAYLRNMLGPLFCASPDEQSRFPALYDRWARRYQPSEAPRPADTTADVELLKVKRGRRIWLIGIGLIAAFGLVVWIALALLGWRLPLPSGLPSPNSNPRPFDKTAIWWETRSFFAGLLAFVCYRLWLFYRARRLFLVRETTNQLPSVDQVSFEQGAAQLFDPAIVARIAQSFRQRIDIQANALDLEATVAQTVQRHGWFSPVYGRRRLQPEYLVLIERTSPGDHQAAYLGDLIEQLARQMVLVSLYHFSGDPRICFPHGRAGAATTLPELAYRHANQRLLIISDGRSLFDTATGEPGRWMELLRRWPERALLTPEPQEHWGYYEEVLRQEIAVLPATFEGLASLAQLFDRRTIQSAQAAPSRRGRLPEELRARALRWIDSAAPDPTLVERILERLHWSLGEAGYFWLCACAVYPAIDWSLTLYLGAALSDSAGQPLIKTASLLDLSRLPWFRYARMPDWLREQLIDSLGVEREREVRAALTALLLRAVRGEDAGPALQIARKHRAALTALAGPLAHLLRRREPEGALQDYVFLRFMGGWYLRPLALHAPARLARLWRGGYEDEPGWSILAKWAAAAAMMFGTHILTSNLMNPLLQFYGLNADLNPIAIIGIGVLPTSMVYAIAGMLALRRHLIRLRGWLIGTPAIAVASAWLWFVAGSTLGIHFSDFSIWAQLTLNLLFFSIVAGSIGWVQSFSFRAAREVRAPWTIVTPVAYSTAVFFVSWIVFSLMGRGQTDPLAIALFTLICALVYTAITGPVLLWALGRRIHFRPRPRPWVLQLQALLSRAREWPGKLRPTAATAGAESSETQDSSSPALDAAPQDDATVKPSQSDIDHLLELLKIYRQTLARYLKQRALVTSALEPPAITAGIRETRQGIARNKAILRAWGVQVANHPDDEESAIPTDSETAKPPQSDIDQLLERLKIHRATLAHYLRQRAVLSATYEPPSIVAGLREAGQEIARLKTILRAWGVPVEDHPDDGGDRHTGMPFTPARPLSPPEPIFGRDILMNQIVRDLLNGRSINLVGTKGMGKTTLLNYLLAKNGPLRDTPITWVRLNLGTIHDSGQFYAAVVTGLLTALSDEPRRQPEPAALFDEMYHTDAANAETLRRVLAIYARLQPPRSPLLVIDNFEYLLRPTAVSAFHFPVFFNDLREMRQGRGLLMLVASDEPIARYTAERRDGLTSSFHDGLSIRRLSPLSEADAEAFLLQPGRYTLTNAEVRAACDWARGHPALLQDAGSALYRARDEEAGLDVAERYYREQIPALRTLFSLDGGFLPWLRRLPGSIRGAVGAAGRRIDSTAAWISGTLMLILAGLILSGVIPASQVFEWLRSLLGL